MEQREGRGCSSCISEMFKKTEGFVADLGEHFEIQGILYSFPHDINKIVHLLETSELLDKRDIFTRIASFSRKTKNMEFTPMSLS